MMRTLSIVLAACLVAGCNQPPVAMAPAAGVPNPDTSGLGAPTQPTGLRLVKDGQPSATIVIAAQPSENAQAAAAEFQFYVQKISGAKLPIVDDAQTPSGPLVLIGRSKLVGDEVAGLRIPAGLTKGLREEGFVLVSDGQRLVLAGNDTPPYYGTRYAVCEMLERLGVRWFMPGAFGEVVPKLATIEVPAIRALQQPDFPLRNYWQHGKDTMPAEDAEWKIHNKMNPRGQDWFGVPNDGSIDGYLPKDQFKDHPEWFALGRDGKREPTMACMTSPDMIRHFVERVKAEARAGKRFSAFAPQDGMPRCYCPNCARIATSFDGYGANERDPLPEASTSNEWFHFVGSILKEVNKEFPDHLIATNGYANRDIPPETLDPAVAKNLVVMFANICACTIHRYDDPHCWQMQRQGRMVKRWCELSDKVWIYNYNYTMLVSKYTITPLVHRLRRNIPLLKEWGLLGFYDQEGEGNWELTGIPTRIVRARLEWNTKADVDAVLNDFYGKWFGRAARPMQAYYDALERAFDTTDAHGHEDVILNHVYTPELMAELGKRIRQAESLAGSDAEKSHVALERVMYDYLRDYVAMEAAKRQGKFAQAAACAQKLVDGQKKLNAITPFMGYHPYPVYEPAWEAKRMSDLAARTDGPAGRLVAMLPETSKARTDPFDDGRYERWHQVKYDDSGWKTIRTTAGWDNQGFMDDNGRPYRGVMWYRLDVKVPADAKGKPVSLHAPAAVEEVWVWVNGQYAGHRPYTMPWWRPQAVDLDVTGMLQPGKTNQVTLRVLANIDVFGASGIYEGMFLYSPTAAAPK